MAQAADADDRVLITKDGDFRDGQRLRASPRRLLIVSTGNIGNDELLAIFARHLGLLVTALESAGMVEFGHDRVEVVERPEFCERTRRLAGFRESVVRRSGLVCFAMRTLCAARLGQTWDQTLHRRHPARFSGEARPKYVASVDVRLPPGRSR